MRLVSQILVSIFLAVSLVGCAMHRLENAVEDMGEGDTFQSVCESDGMWEGFGSMEKCVSKAQSYARKWAKIKNKKRGFNFSGFASEVSNSNNNSKSFGEYMLENRSKQTSCVTRRDALGQYITECQ